MHDEARRYVLQQLRMRTFYDLPIIEVGARNINGDLRSSYPGEGYKKVPWITSDISEGPGVDVVADGECLPFPDECAGTVISCETFEHASRWPFILYEAFRVLRSKGHLIITTACDPRAPHSGVDGGPVSEGEHYRNVDPTLFCEVLRAARFVDIEVSVLANRGDIRAYAKKP